MTDVLDGTVAEIKARRFSVDEARALLAAEEAGKTRKMVIAHLQSVIEAAPTESRYIVTADGAGRIQHRKNEFYAEGDGIDGEPEPLADLERRGFIRLV